MAYLPACPSCGGPVEVTPLGLTCTSCAHLVVIVAQSDGVRAEVAPPGESMINSDDGEG